tara:strand:- start:225 stop:386 length:162 start_codon:yes stop_codon:yes gene_type:complete
MDNVQNLLATTTAGVAGSGATYWLNQINPWLAFISGVLTITFMSIGIYKSIRK